MTNREAYVFGWVFGRLNVEAYPQEIGGDFTLAALPAGDHRLIYAHGVRKLGLSQAFGLSGGGNIKLGRRKRALAFTGKKA